MNNITEFIGSGILELYVMGSTSPEEAAEVERMAAAHPEIRQEIDTISQSIEAYALAHAVPPKASVKPLLLATIDYMERLKQGEPAETPPAITPTSRIGDFAAWLNRPDLHAPADAADIYVKIIGATPGTTTAIAWIKDTAGEEIHHQELERFLIVEGTCDIIIGEEAHHLASGDYFSIPLHVPHIVKVTSSIPCKAVVQRVSV